MRTFAVHPTLRVMYEEVLRLLLWQIAQPIAMSSVFVSIRTGLHTVGDVTMFSCTGYGCSGV